ncbi:uncharacterized protein [Argopecten irradians]|uniref:uncharacterized protein n=1 Tax=Argopecten irradians TaxID=31199 RepID=UPI003717B245
METEQRNNLQQNHVTLVDQLDPCDIIDDLFEDGILTENDCDHIKSCKSRKDKCRLLLIMLPTCGPSAYGSFLNSLKADYNHLARVVRSSIPRKDFVKTKPTENTGLHSRHILNACSRCTHNIPPFTIPELESLIKQNCCLIFENLEASDLLDLHYQEFVFGIEEYERIKSGKTRLDRCIVFISELARCRGSQVKSVFMRSLENKYGYIARAIKQSTQSLQAIAHHVQEPILKAESRTGFWAQTENLLLKEHFCQSLPTHLLDKPSTNIFLCSEAHKIDNESSNQCRVRRNRRFQKKRRKLNQRSHRDQVFSCYEDTAVDIKLNQHSAMERLNESNTTEDLKLCKFESMLIPDFVQMPSFLNGEEPKAQSESQIRRLYQHSARPLESEREKDTHPQNMASKCNRLVTKTDYLKYCSEPTAAKRARKHSTNKRRDLPSVHVCNLSPVTCNPGSAITHSTRPRRLDVAFNSLSTMINQGEFQKFDLYATNIQMKYSEDSDMMCILDYLHASRDLFVTDIHSAKKHINTGLQRVARTSNPKYFTLELFSAQTRMYIAKRKLHKLDSALADAMMMIEADPVGCSGRAAGWLYINQVRDIFRQLAVLSVHQPNYHSVYQTLYDSAVKSCQRALDNFKCDGGKDGPFGLRIALCRLAILLLRCGENGLTMDIQHPASRDIDFAGRYLKQLEKSVSPLPKILEVYNLVAKSDLQYRRGYSAKAIEHAEAAYQLAKEINLQEFIGHAHNRVVFLNKMPISTGGVADEGVSMATDSAELSNSIMDTSSSSSHSE